MDSFLESFGNVYMNLGRTLLKYPDGNFNDFFSKGQIESKSWLIDKLRHLDLELGTVFICAGWYGSLAGFIHCANIKYDKIRSFDIDETCAPIADNLNRYLVIDGWKFKASTLDILKMSYPTTHTTYRANGTSLELTEMPDTIINTSCEHIKDFKKWYDDIPQGTLMILQSNNYFEIEEHVNCVEDIYEFKDMAPMSELYYMGMRDMSKYTRFMLIGKK